MKILLLQMSQPMVLVWKLKENIIIQIGEKYYSEENTENTIAPDELASI